MRRGVPWSLAVAVAILAAAGILAVADSSTQAERREMETASSAAAKPGARGFDLERSTTTPAPPELPAPTTTTVTTAAHASQPAAPPAADAGPPRVVLWGDSLAWESASLFAWAVRNSGAEVETRTLGGTAPCDWYAEIMQWPADKRIDVAVLEFSGNWKTPCMRADGALSSAARVAKYRTDVGSLARHLRDRGAHVYLIGPPLMRPDFEPGRAEALLELYRELADEDDENDGITFADAGASVLAGGLYTDTLPCLPWEGVEHGCRDGIITVRSPDGVHFCPGDLKGGCQVYSSGAFRFAMAMVTAATENVRQ